MFISSKNLRNQSKILSPIMQVEQLEVGALVSIRGVSRVKILEFKQASK